MTTNHSPGFKTERHARQVAKKWANGAREPFVVVLFRDHYFVRRVSGRPLNEIGVVVDTVRPKGGPRA